MFSESRFLDDEVVFVVFVVMVNSYLRRVK